jgi:3-deoxy-D-manno-octulosonate 8-phosphate phosphatase (KDO 8-P phosphatase)
MAGELSLPEVLVRIKLLALDSDGVLTDGGVYVSDEGTEYRRFSIKDGLGLRRLMQEGIHVAIVSSAAGGAVEHRARRLNIKEVHCGVEDKLRALTEICKRYEVTFEEVAFIGDDVTDVPGELRRT